MSDTRRDLCSKVWLVSKTWGWPTPHDTTDKHRANHNRPMRVKNHKFRKGMKNSLYNLEQKVEQIQVREAREE